MEWTTGFTTFWGALLGGGVVSGLIITLFKIVAGRITDRADEAVEIAKSADRKANKSLQKQEVAAGSGPFVSQATCTTCAEGNNAVLESMERTVTQGFNRLSSEIKGMRTELQAGLARVHERVDTHIDKAARKS